MIRIQFFGQIIYDLNSETVLCCENVLPTPLYVPCLIGTISVVRVPFTIPKADCCEVGRVLALYSAVRVLLSDVVYWKLGFGVIDCSYLTLHWAQWPIGLVSRGYG